MKKDQLNAAVASFARREFTCADVRKATGQPDHTVRKHLFDAIATGKLERVDPTAWLAVFRVPAGVALQSCGESCE